MIKTILKNSYIQKEITTHSATVIFSHGLGDSGAGWIDVMEEIQSRNNGHIRFICPNAPVQAVTLNGGFKMPSWYDIKSLSSRGDEDPAQVDESKNIIETIIKHEMEEEKIPAERIIIGGFSQGAALSLYTFYSQTETKLGGCIALSGYLPLATKFVAISLNKEQPLLMIHGDCDQVVRHQWGKLSFDHLKTQGINGEFITLQGLGHHSSPEEIDSMTKFISKTLPK
ncbi:hypothetical protein ACTFIR_000565 [Dictyostelium discoideum]